MWRHWILYKADKKFTGMIAHGIRHSISLDLTIRFWSKSLRGQEYWACSLPCRTHKARFWHWDQRSPRPGSECGWVGWALCSVPQPAGISLCGGFDPLAPSVLNRDRMVRELTTLIKLLFFFTQTGDQITPINTKV